MVNDLAPKLVYNAVRISRSFVVAKTKAADYILTVDSNFAIKDTCHAVSSVLDRVDRKDARIKSEFLPFHNTTAAKLAAGTMRTVRVV